MTRTAIALLGLVAAGLLFLAVRSESQPDVPLGEGLAVHGPARDVGEVAVDAEESVRFRVTNRSGRPTLIVGLVPG